MRRRPGAPLSPNEEMTLLRVAHCGIAEGAHAASDVRRLAAFELIKTIAGKFVLTGAGRRRVDGLPPTGGSIGHDQAAYGEPGKAMSQFYERWRRKQ